LQAAYHNRAKVVLRNIVKEGGMPTSGIADIEQAIKLGPPTGELYCDAAYLYALGRHGPPPDDAVGRYVKKAIENGWSPDMIRSEPILAPYLGWLEANGSFNVAAPARDVSDSQLLVAPRYEAIDDSRLAD
jgi:hypothetical protein